MKTFVPDHIIDEIRSRADIVEIVSQSVRLKKSGKNYLGLCPFHSEKTPSFTVSAEKRIFHCFGCGMGGNVFKFIMETQSLPFMEVITQLAERYGIALPRTSPEAQKSSDERARLIQLNTRAAEYFASNLRHPELGRVAREYLKSRNLDTQAIERFQLGWALPDWESLIGRFRNAENGSLGQLEKAGLIKARDKGTGYYDRFRNRLIFPLKDAHGSVIGFAGRVLNNEEQPKYLNSPETLLYKKGHQLFGFHEARQAIRRENRVLLVEGYFDQIRAFQNGFQNVVATSGTALTTHQVDLLRNQAGEAVLVFDADQAGQSAAERGYEVLLDRGMKVRVLTLPEGHDPDSFILEHGADAFAGLIDSAPPFMEFMIQKTIRNGDARTPSGRIAIANALVPLLSRIKSPVERNEYIKFLAEQTGLSDASLLEEIKKSLNQNRRQVPENKADEKKGQSAELYLIQLMLKDRECAQMIRHEVEPESFQTPVYKTLLGLLYSQMDHGRSLNIDQLLDQVEDPECHSAFSQIGLSPIHFDDPKKAATDCILRLRKKQMENTLRTLKKEMLEAHMQGESDRSRELQTRLKELQGSLSHV